MQQLHSTLHLHLPYPPLNMLLPANPPPPLLPLLANPLGAAAAPPAALSFNCLAFFTESLPVSPLQTRWAQQLHRLLRLYRKKLGVVLPWRPLYEMLRALFMQPSAEYEGGWFGGLLPHGMSRRKERERVPVYVCVPHPRYLKFYVALLWCEPAGASKRLGVVLPRRLLYAILCMLFMQLSAEHKGGRSVQAHCGGCQALGAKAFSKCTLHSWNEI